MKTEVRSSANLPASSSRRGVRFSTWLGLLTLSGLLAQSVGAALVLTPADGLNANGVLGGPFTGGTKVYTLSNDGGTDVIWTATPTAAWVSCSLGGGVLGPGRSTNLTVFVNALALEFAPASYAATVEFVSTAGSASRSVNLTVTAPGAATWEFGTVTDPNNYRLRITGGGPVNTEYQIHAATNVTGPWVPIHTNVFTSAEGAYDLLATGARRFFRVWSSTSATLSLLTSVVQDRLQLIVRGTPYGTYALDVSADGNPPWTPVLTNRASAEGTFTYNNPDPNLTNYQVRAVTAPVKPVVDQVLIVGESLAIAFDGGPALSTTPSPVNYRFYADASTTNLTPLAEASVETMASGAANHISANTPGRRVMTSNIGSGNMDYTLQRKGTENYAWGLQQFLAAPQSAALQLLSVRPRAIFSLGGNGSSDWNNPAYGLSVRQWQADYEADVQRLTGYTFPLPMFHSQVSEWTTPTMGANATAQGPISLLAEAEANPSKTVLVGPRYHLPHAVAGANFPGLHLSNVGNRWLGEYYAKVYKKVVIDGGTWTPLKPRTLSRTGAVITITFDVPVAPLVLDTTLVSDPGNYGFEYTDDSGAPPAISSVQLTGSDTVTITLAATPTGANKRVRYAYTGIPGNPAGPTTGPRGNLRDSDPTPSLYGHTLYNWCVHFDKPVN